MQSRAPEGSPYFFLHDDEQEEAWALLRQRCKDSLYFLSKGVIGFKDLTDPLHRPHCNFLQLAPWNCPWPEARNKISIMPRNHFKSTNCSVSKPIWFLIHNPQATINLISAVEDNTMKWLTAIEQVFNTNDMFRWLFDELIPKYDRWEEESKHAFTVPRDEQLMPEPQPSIQATSIVSGQASKHVDHAILDDPVNEMTVDSPRLVDRAVGLYKLLESTLQDYETSTLEVTATPWGFGDVIETALETEVAAGEMLMWKIGCYGQFEMSKHFDEYARWQLPHSHRFLSTDMMRYTGTPGEPIFPKRYPRAELERLERKYGTFLFSCNYLCNPFDPSLSGFSPDYLRKYQIQSDGRLTCECHPEHVHKMSELHIVMTVDPAFSDKDAAAESAITVGGLAEDGCRYLFEAWSDKVEADKLWFKIVERIVYYQPWLQDVGIEAVAAQRLFKYWFEFLQQIMSKLDPEERKLYEKLEHISFVDLKPDNDIDKIRRIKAQQLPLANGFWHIQYGMDKFLGQYTKFPRARPVDILDAWAYLEYMWTIPTKDAEDEASSMDWGMLRREYHRQHQLYGGNKR